MEKTLTSMVWISNDHANDYILPIFGCVDILPSDCNPLLNQETDLRLVNHQHNVEPEQCRKLTNIIWIVKQN
jgi:hypothetical protein